MTIPTKDISLQILDSIRASEAERRREFRTLQEYFVDLNRTLSRIDRHISDVERRVGDIGPSFELRIAMEFMGIKSQFDAKLDEHLAAITERLKAR